MTAYGVEVAPLAAREFRKLPTEIRDRIRAGLVKLAIEAAETNQFRGKAVKAIRGTGDSFNRLRVGDYRVMFDVIEGEQVILVLGVVHRGDLETWIRNR